MPTGVLLGLSAAFLAFAKHAAGTTGIAVVFSSLSGFAGRVSIGNINLVLIAVSVIAAGITAWPSAW